MRARTSFQTVLCIVFLFCATSLHAQWVKDGAPICTATSNQYYPQIVGDGAGGAIIAWWDGRPPSNHLYAQRVDAYGNPLWAANGVDLCPNSNYQYNPIAITTDDAGGAIVTWRDGRIPEGIYAQRIDADGNILWGNDAVTVCGENGNQQYPQIVADGSGGAVIVWEDQRSGDIDIYAQRIDASGTALWTAGGVAICALSGAQEKPHIAADPFYLFIAWQDYRNGNYDIFAQALDRGGAAQWTANGVAVCVTTNAQTAPQILPTGYGGAIIVWQDYRTGAARVYLQHLNSVGNNQWTSNGIAVSGASGEQYRPRIVSDGTTAGSIVVWDTYYDIYAQRFNGVGAAQWTTDGVPVCAASGNQQYPRIAREESGGVMVVWSDYRTAYETDVYAQRLDGSGNARWASNGVGVSTGVGAQADPQIASDGARGAIVTWYDLRASNSNVDIYAQRIEENGYWGYPAPDIYRVRDVPGDQGGSMSASWYASRLDPLPDGLISSYTIWRAIDEAQATAALESGAPLRESLADFDPAVEDRSIRTQELAGGTFFWELVASVDAYHLASYSKVVPTLFDSTASCTDPHYLQVIAHTADSRVFWISAPDSGRSIDNLAPAPPVGLAGEQRYTPSALSLTWSPSSESDLQGYTVYRGTSADFVPGPENLVTSTADTLYLDREWTWDAGYYYKVAAIDIHGNESGYALLAPDGITGDDTPKAPPTNHLAQNVPNPFNPATRIAFGIAATGRVSLRIYDAAGRLVRVLAEGARPAGHYTELWDGRDARGAAVASGIYFYRLKAGAFSETRKMILLR
jgi:hypothetical protein